MSGPPRGVVLHGLVDRKRVRRVTCTEEEHRLPFVLDVSRVVGRFDAHLAHILTVDTAEGHGDEGVHELSHRIAQQLVEAEFEAIAAMDGEDP